MTELSFLIDLLLNQKLSKPVKDLIANRIREIESKVAPSSGQNRTSVPGPPAHLIGQAPSTIANWMKDNPSPMINAVPANIEPQAHSEPGILVASQAAAGAINARQQMIDQALSGKPAQGQASPPKFLNLKK